MSAALLETQRRFLGALREPLAGEPRALASLPPGASAPSDAFHATADSLLRSTATVHARERLGLYHRQYWFRLIDSLAEDFPRVRELLGPDAFLAAIERHLAARPPSCWTLRHLGADFAGALRDDPDLPPDIRPWAAAMATFEYAHMQVFEAASLPAPADADLAARALALQPAVALVLADRPLSRLLGKTPPRDAVATAATRRVRRELHVVWRTSGHAMRSRREPLALLPLLQALRRGGTLTEIISTTCPLPRPDLIQTAFARWRSLGWLGLAS